MTTMTRREPLDAALLDRVEALQSAAEYLTCIAEILIRDVASLRDSVRAYGPGTGPIADLDDWREFRVLLSLTIDQADIVRDVSHAVGIARVRA